MDIVVAWRVKKIIKLNTKKWDSQYQLVSWISFLLMNSTTWANVSSKESLLWPTDVMFEPLWNLTWFFNRLSRVNRVATTDLSSIYHHSTLWEPTSTWSFMCFSLGTRSPWRIPWHHRMLTKKNLSPSLVSVLRWFPFQRSFRGVFGVGEIIASQNLTDPIQG